MSDTNGTIIEEILQAKFEPNELKSYTKEWTNKRGEQKKAGPFTYVEDETVMDRLDFALGLGGWSVRADPMGENVVRVTLAVRHPVSKEWTEYQDFGYATNADSPEPLKEAWTDGFRRVARIPGVARYVYAGEAPAPTTQGQTAVPAQAAPTAPAAAPQPVAAPTDSLYDSGKCPAHGWDWKVQPGGNRKTDGKPYKAFYKCGGKTSTGAFCPEKPTDEWVAAHPISA